MTNVQLVGRGVYELQRKVLLLSGGSGFATPFKRPLVGALHKAVIPIADPQHQGSVVRCYVDDSGKVRRPLGWSDFCLVTDWQYDNAMARANIDYGAKLYHYCRDFRRLGESATGGYYGPRSVLMPWCIKAFWDAVEYGAQYDLRWQVSHGFQYTSRQQRLDFEGAWALEGQRRNLARYLLMVELDNEYWQNGWLRWDLDAQREEGYQVEKLWRSIFNPCPFIVMGAPADTGPNNLLKATLTDRLAEVHTARDRPAMSKHVFALWWMEGYPGRLVTEDANHNRYVQEGLHYLCGEQTPMFGGPDDFMGVTNPGAQFAQLSMGTMAPGAPQTYFDGWDVRDPGPITLDAPTLETFPMFMSNIPEDACTWPPDHGSPGLPRPLIYHWRRPNSHECITVLDELWAYQPPRPWAKWTAYGCARDLNGAWHDGGTIIDGPAGTQPQDVLPPDFGGCLIHGELT